MHNNKSKIIIIFSLLISLSIVSCNSSKNISESSVTTEGKQQSKPSATPETQEMKKLLTSSSSFSCSGESNLQKLTIHGAPAKCKAVSCTVSRFGSGDNAGLKIRYKATLENETVQVFFHLHGVEDDKIKPGVYQVSKQNSDKYGKIYLESGNPKEIQEITIYTGTISIDDYGYSSNVICGSIKLEDDKGNQVQGSFNEIILGL